MGNWPAPLAKIKIGPVGFCFSLAFSVFPGEPRWPPPWLSVLSPPSGAASAPFPPTPFQRSLTASLTPPLRPPPPYSSILYSTLPSLRFAFPLLLAPAQPMLQPILQFFLSLPGAARAGPSCLHLPRRRALPFAHPIW